MLKYPRQYARKCPGFPRACLPFLTHNMARPPKTCWSQIFVSAPRKICEKMGDATLSVRTLCFSIGATLGVIGLFLPHNIAAERGQHHEGKKGEKGHAT